MGGGFICLGKIEIGFLKGRLVFKTRHFVNWRCCENFFSFLFFFVAWHTFAEKHKCCHKIGIRSTNNNHLYSAILLRNNAITNSCFLFFFHSWLVEINRLKRTSQFLPVVYLLDFPRPSGKPFQTEANTKLCILIGFCCSTMVHFVRYFASTRVHRESEDISENRRQEKINLFRTEI